LKAWVAEGYPTSPDGNPVSPGEHFHFDMMCVGGWFDALPLRGVEEVVEETDEWLRCFKRSTPVGLGVLPLDQDDLTFSVGEYAAAASKTMIGLV